MLATTAMLDPSRRKDYVKLDAQIIEGFASSCLVKYFDNPSPFAEFHREWWDLCTSSDKFVAICAPRGHSKSTTVTVVYALTAALFRNRKYILIVGDTEAQAALFLGQIKQIMLDSSEIHNLFDLKLNEFKEPDFEKDTETDIIVSFNDGNKFRIIAKGAEQKLRGLLWDGSRPDLILIDDLMNEELVMNKARRDKLRRWVYGSLIPCRSEDGIIRFIGTPMNMDDPLESLMPKEHGKNTVTTELKTSSMKKIGMWQSVKYRAHSSPLTPDSELLWPQRKSAREFMELRQDFMEQGIPEVYSCEYLCNPVDDSIRFFKRTDFPTLTEEDRKKDKNFYITADLAISEKDRANYTAFVIAGMDQDGILQVVNVIRERMDGLAIVETILALEKMYKPLAFGIEEMMITKSIGPFLKRQMIETGIFPNVIGMSPYRMDKVTRARSIQARMRAGAVKFDKVADWWPGFENEMLQFPRSKHDDMVDCMSYLGLLVDKMNEGRTEVEIDSDRYADEFEAPDTNQIGRSRTTGY
jgi:predicted phage terminase large subunit-like protein